jgi:hypothetical protein
MCKRISALVWTILKVLATPESVPSGRDPAPAGTAEDANTVTPQGHGPFITIPSTPSSPPTSAAIKRDDEVPDFDSMIRYFRGLEERIQSLELQVVKLAGSSSQRGEKAATMSRLSRQTSSTSVVAGILKLTRDEFEGSGQKEESVYAIELLVGDDDAVRKIRVRSKQLLKTFQTIMGTDIVPDPSHSMVITRPFTVLMIFERELKDKKAHLDQELEGQTFHDSNEYLEATTNPTRSSDIIESDKSAVKKYLDILLQAITIYLADDYAAYLSMRARSWELITFPHLCYLFQPGDIVLDGRDQSAQAYCVLSVHEKITKGSQDTAGALPDITRMLSINCFYFGYNGKIFGPVAKAFTIRHFHGMRSVTLLPIIPIQSLKEDDIQNMLIQRGSKFTLLTTPRHQTYSGMTIDKELPTEVGISLLI